MASPVLKVHLETRLVPSEPLEIRVDFHAPERVDDVVFSIALFDQEGNLLLGTNSDLMGDDPGTVAGDGTCVFSFERFPLLDGVYLLSVGIHSHDGGVIYDQRAEKDTVEVSSPGQEVGLVHFPVRARVEPRATLISG